MADEVKLDRLEINDGNAQQILKSGEVAGDLRARAQAIAAAAAAGRGGTYRIDAMLWKSRNAVHVTTADTEARRAEATDRTLTKALDAGR
jgi:hypothetical protein